MPLVVDAGRICNRCTGCVAMATQREREMLASACTRSKYSIYAWLHAAELMLLIYTAVRTMWMRIIYRKWFLSTARVSGTSSDFKRAFHRRRCCSLDALQKTIVEPDEDRTTLVLHVVDATRL